MPLVVGTRKIISRGITTGNKPIGRRMAKPGFDLVHIIAGSIQFGSDNCPKLSKNSMYRNDKQE